MDRWLDDLARAAASGVSRRKLLRRILTGVLAGATGTAVARRASAGAVVCSGDQVNCGGCCVSLGSDRNNCGACGHVCPVGQVCSGGMCATSCAGAFVNCGDNCVFVQIDPHNCGDCGVVCPQNQACVRGTCVPRN